MTTTDELRPVAHDAAAETLFEGTPAQHIGKLWERVLILEREVAALRKLVQARASE